MTLTGRFFAIYGFIQLVGIAGLVYPQAVWAYGALTILFLPLALWDRKTLADAADVEISAEGPREARLGANSSVKARVQLRTRKAFLSQEIFLLAPEISLFHFKSPAVGFSPRKLVASEGLYAHEFEAEVLELGYVSLDSWPLSIVSALGLLKRVLQLPVPKIEFRVSPERVPLREQAFAELIQTQRILNPGARLQVKARAADLFHSIRKYQSSDSIRHLDAKKSARYGEPMTRVFEEQHNHHLVIAFDTGRAMSGAVRGSRKADYYLSAALALAENAVRSRDQVSLFSFSQSSRRVIRRAQSLVAFQSLFRAAPEFVPRDEETDFGLLPKLVASVAPTRAIVVVLTDLSKPSVQDSLLEALQPICRKHLTVVISLEDRENDLEQQVLQAGPLNRAARAAEAANLLYAYWSKERQLLFREKFARIGGGSLIINDSDWIASVEKLYSLLRTSRLA